MTEQIDEGKSFGPKLFDGDQDLNCGVEDLQHIAVDENAAIDRVERSVTPHCWRLGKALNLLRKNFARGQWSPLLTELNISKARASKARAIHRAFTTVDDVEGLSVDQAYDRRHRRSRKRATDCDKRQEATGGQDISGFLHEFGMETDRHQEEVAAPQPAKASELLETIEAVIEDLSRLRDRLREKAAEV